MKKTKYDDSQNYLLSFFIYLFLGLFLIGIPCFFSDIVIKTFDDKVTKILVTILKYFNILAFGPLFFILAFRTLFGYLKGKLC